MAAGAVGAAAGPAQTPPPAPQLAAQPRPSYPAHRPAHPPHLLAERHWLRRAEVSRQRVRAVHGAVRRLGVVLLLGALCGRGGVHGAAGASMCRRKLQVAAAACQRQAGQGRLGRQPDRWAVLPAGLGLKATGLASPRRAASRLRPCRTNQHASTVSRADPPVSPVMPAGRLPSSPDSVRSCFCGVAEGEPG